MIKRVFLLVALAVAAFSVSCGKGPDRLKDLDPPHVATQFFETWKKKDWKALYRITDAAFMRALRTQKLTPDLQRLNDEELFVRQFTETQRLNPDRVLKSYRVDGISPYTKGDTMVWLYATVNGRKKKIAMTIDGMALKIDLTRIEDVSGGEVPSTGLKK
ncbi:MAG TPA: hypothetical protein PKN50_17620 [Spirochaetota bacterium]|nr:hypothetical protein [Spirochaetota bacterium]